MDVLGSLFTVERAIPDSVLAGLATGDYSLHGGVVRNTTGQIVRHLIPAASRSLDPFGLISAPFEMFNTYQLHNLKKMSEQIMAVSTATMAMSGLGLAVSAVGFAAMHQSLKKVDRRLKDIGEDIKWIRSFLEAERHAALLDAAQDLENLPVDINHRTQVLHNHRSKVGQVAMQYLQAWEDSLTGGLLESISSQHYYCTAFLMKARCSAELGMYDNALVELTEGITQWREKSRYIANEKILQGDEHRFLDDEYLPSVPAAKLVEWMDFSAEEARGWDWIDHLRFKPKYRWTLPIHFESRQEKFEREHLIEIMDSLVKRDNVLGGYQAQYKFFLENKITPSTFEDELKTLSKPDAANEVLILAPREVA